MFEFLNRPHLFSFQPARRIKQLLPVGLFVFVFLVLLRPFGLRNIQEYIQISALLSILGTLSGLITTVLIPYCMPAFFDESKWTVKRNMIWSAGGNLLFATLMYLGYHVYGIILHNVYPYFTSKTYVWWNSYSWWFSFQVIFGLPLGIIINYLNQYYLLTKHLKIAERINTTTPIYTRHNSAQYLEFEVDKFKKLHVDVNDLIYVEASGNYITIVYCNNGFKKITIRETIASVEQKIRESNSIYKPHRSYLVNLQNIERVTGDSQGLKIHLKGFDKVIPVSRNKIKEFRRHITGQL